MTAAAVIAGAPMRRVVALVYHSVAAGSGRAAWRWGVSLDQFCQQLDKLSSLGYKTVTVQDLIAGRLPAGDVVAITFDDGYADNLHAAEELQRRDMRASWYVVTGAVGRPPHWPADGRPEGKLLTGPHLRALRAAGMEVGSHTCSHVRLPAVDDHVLLSELRDSRTALEDLLGEPVTGFAYPYGAWDARCAAVVRETGYAYALTTDTGWALRDADPYRIRRLTIFNGDNANRVARKLALGSHDVGWGDMARYLARRAAGRLARHG